MISEDKLEGARENAYRCQVIFKKFRVLRDPGHAPSLKIFKGTHPDST